MLSSLLMIFGFGLVIIGAKWLVNGAGSLARELKISEVAVGLTVVAFGTSMPELFVNITASIHRSSEIAISNVIGSNIANILLILGLSAVIYPLTVCKGTVWKQIPLALLASVLAGVLANDSLIDHTGYSAITRIDGLVLMFFFIIFIYYTTGIAAQVPGLAEHTPRKKYGLIRSAALIAIGLLFLILGSDWIVRAAVNLARALQISESLIGLTIVAVGTSLPELATSVTAAYKRNVEIAVGNIIGSNIFNVFFILGVSSTIRPISFSTKSNVDVAVAVLVSLLLFLSMFTGKKRTLDRWEGAVFLVLYAGYIVFLIIRG